MTTTDDIKAKVEALREQARDCYRREAESFARCDTDGFLSQAALTSMARKYNAEADLIESGGTCTTWVLADLDGNVVSTHQGFSKYGEWWRLDDEAAERYGKRFYSPSNASKGVDAAKRDRAKGFTFVLVEGEGEVVMSGWHPVTQIKTSVMIERNFKIVQRDYVRLGVGDDGPADVRTTD